MTSCCEDAPCDNRGYNVCIENTTALDVLFEFYYAVPALLPEGATVQSVTVEAGNSICYRINVPPGAVLGVRTIVDGALPLLSTFYISCSTHLKAFLTDNEDLAVSSDCSPCPVACELACNKKESCLPKKPSPCKTCA